MCRFAVLKVATVIVQGAAQTAPQLEVTVAAVEMAAEAEAVTVKT